MSGKTYDCFLTHDWGMDNQGRENHQRVIKISNMLQEKGLKPWIDEVEITGDVVDQMCKGIDDSSCVIAFITKTYVDKVSGDDDKDNCKREFKYAVSQKGIKLIIPVLMEERMKEESMWRGRIKMDLYGVLWVPMWDDQDLKLSLDQLVKEIILRVPSIGERIKQQRIQQEQEQKKKQEEEQEQEQRSRQKSQVQQTEQKEQQQEEEDEDEDDELTIKEKELDKLEKLLLEEEEKHRKEEEKLKKEKELKEKEKLLKERMRKLEELKKERDLELGIGLSDDVKSIIHSSIDGKSVNLSGKSFISDYMPYLRKYLEENCPDVEKLNLSRNEIGVSGVMQLLKANFANLKELFVHSNMIGNNGAILLSSANFPRLEKLGLSGNNIDDSGAISFTLSEFPNLKELFLLNNPIADRAFVSNALKKKFPKSNIYF